MNSLTLVSLLLSSAFGYAIGAATTKFEDRHQLSVYLFPIVVLLFAVMLLAAMCLDLSNVILKQAQIRIESTEPNGIVWDRKPTSFTIGNDQSWMEN